MSNGLKYLFIFGALILIGVAAVLVLNTTKIPPAADPVRIEKWFPDELALMRGIALDLPGSALKMPEFSSNQDPEEIRRQFDAFEKPLKDLETRAEALDHPAILSSSLRIKNRGGGNELRMVLSGNEVTRDGWSLLAKSPSMNNPAVSRLITGSTRLVRYEEMVSVSNGRARIFELIFDLDQLDEMYEKSQAELSDRQE